MRTPIPDFEFNNWKRNKYFNNSKHNVLNYTEILEVLRNKKCRTRKEFEAQLNILSRQYFLFYLGISKTRI